MGYVTGGGKKNRDRPRKTAGEAAVLIIYVQAILLWSAGSLQLGEYERTVQERKEVEARLMPPAG